MKTMKKLLLFFAFVIHISVYGQLADFYFKDGGLKISALYKVSDSKTIPEYYDGTRVRRSFTYNLIYNVNYPKYWMDSAVEGLVIAKISLGIDTTTRYDKLGYGKVINVEIVKAPENSQNEELISYFKFLNKGGFYFPENFDFQSTFTMYIPLLFRLNKPDNEGSEDIYIKKYFKDSVVIIEGTGLVVEVERNQAH
jgi:hypothetical protein